MGAKLAQPDKLCINVWGDAAIGFTGMDFETAVRERIPILSILLNNFSMAIELHDHEGRPPRSTARTDICGNYADMAKALRRLRRARHRARRDRPGHQARASRKTQEGTPALLEFITEKEIEFSIFK